MDFFEHQERARRNSRWLVLWYAVAVLCVIASYCVVAALGYAFIAMYGAAPLAGDGPLEWQGLGRTYIAALVRVPVELYLLVGGTVAGFILAVSAYRIWQLSDGGPTIAYLLGARYIEPGKCTPTERRLLNVVEELAIASGISLPAVYVLDRDDAINALVAGYSPNEAVIIVTHGAVHKLSRDELQGVMGHEFSHILNGDMALNLRLVGILAGLTRIGDYGEELVYRAAWHTKDLPREERGAEAPAALFGALVALIGFPELSPLRPSRQRFRVSASCSPTRQAFSSRATPMQSPGRSIRSSPCALARLCARCTVSSSRTCFSRRRPAAGGGLPLTRRSSNGSAARTRASTARRTGRDVMARATRSR